MSIMLLLILKVYYVAIPKSVLEIYINDYYPKGLLSKK